jgi:hypothetical protein
LSPWREPLRDRERVEAFRTRMRRIVRLHKNGLGTVRALRTMTMAALPQVDADAPAGLRERSFTVEEFSGAGERRLAIAQAGIPDDLLGPLMRWRLDSQSLDAAPASVIIKGIAPLAGQTDPTSQPIIERFDPATGTGAGLHYDGDLAADEALALVPAFQCWLGMDAGIELAGSEPDALTLVDPTAAGPWSVVGGAPTGSVVDLQQSADHYLWAAVNDAGSGSLWRSDGASWEEILSGLPELHCLLPRGHELLVGGAAGLSRLEIQPLGAFALAPDPGGMADAAVRALGVDAAGTLWAATDTGLAREQAGLLVYTDLGGRAETETALRCLLLEPSGDVYCGGELGVFLYRASRQRWYILQGEGVDENVDDWRELDLIAGALPGAEEIFVPQVNALARGPAVGLWLGTEQGVARYRAREQRHTYTTLLEALPQLTEAAVTRIALDARRRLWFASNEGLFVYDSLDWFQRQGAELVRLPRQEDEPEHPVFWRYERGGANWQSLTPPSNAGFVNYTGTQLGNAEQAVRALTWTESARAVLGTFDGTDFAADAAAVPGPLAMRYKPEATRIVAGGIPALPRLPSGISHWRYLQLEQVAPPTPSANPAWTREGRLLPLPDEAPAPYEGRYLADLLAQGDSVFAFPPAARVWFLWQPREPLAVTVRLASAASDEHIDPLILDRVWGELQRVKPAGVRVYLAVDEQIVRGL